jgi:hypothetical protein
MSKKTSDPNALVGAFLVLMGLSILAWHSYQERYQRADLLAEERLRMLDDTHLQDPAQDHDNLLPFDLNQLVYAPGSDEDVLPDIPLGLHLGGVVPSAGYLQSPLLQNTGGLLLLAPAVYLNTPPR